MGYDFLLFSYQIIRPVYERSDMHRRVIEEVEDPQLRKAYARCRAITRNFAKSFYLATRFLPRHKQRSIFAIYALCRYLDNLVDETEDLIRNKKIRFDDIERIIQNCREELLQTYEGHETDNPIFLSFSEVLKFYNIPIELPFMLMEGISTDLTKNRYATFDELYDYSYKVASVVGLMISEVFGYTSKRALQHSIDLGIAMQLTNILRDFGEDLRNDRIYLPKEDFAKFGLTCEDLKMGKVDHRFIGLMKYQISRTRLFYEKADKGIPMLSRDSQLPVYLARHNYARILDRIEKNGYDVFNQRAFLSMRQKLVILPKIWWNL